MTGPSCIDNTINNCQLTAPGTKYNTDSRRSSNDLGTVAPAPRSSPTFAPQSQPTFVPQSQPTLAPQSQPMPSQPLLRVCVSNHPTIDYTVSCKALVATCEQHTFCKLVSSGAPTPIPLSSACISNHPTLDYSAACKALAATCEQHTYCKRELVGESETQVEPEPESEPENEPESEPESKSEPEPESEPERDSDSGLELNPEPEPESEPEHEPDVEPESKSEPEPESEPEHEPASEPESNSEPEPESEPEHEQKSEPESGSESEPVSTSCVPIGICGSHAWCNQDQFDAWCRDKGRSGGCPLPFCKVPVDLAQLPARRYLRVAKRRFAQTRAAMLIQQTTNVSCAKKIDHDIHFQDWEQRVNSLGHFEL